MLPRALPRSAIGRTVARPCLSRATLAPRLILATPTRSFASSAATPTPITEQKAPSLATTTTTTQKKKKSIFIRLRNGLIWAILGGAGVVVAYSYQLRHPGEQLPFDPDLPTVVVLGNGWGATAFLSQLDNEDYNVVVISPRNYFLFTPLLPSVTVGTLDPRSILQPTRFITRHKKREVRIYEGESTKIDVANKTVIFEDNSELKEKTRTAIKYDYLVNAVGAENNTFGIKGVKEHACFLKEVWDAQKVRRKVMDAVESAHFPDLPEEEVARLLHFVVVGGGPTGVEYAGELHDFLVEDLKHWYPSLASKVKITLIEALPNVLPMFSKQLIDYTMSTFQDNAIEIRTKTMVKEVKPTVVIAQNAEKQIEEIPYGTLVWATGNTSRPVTLDLIKQLPDVQTSRRGLLVDEHLRVLGADGVFALGDCTSTSYAPTAQVATQQGRYLGRILGQLAKKQKLVAELEQAKKAGADSSQLDSLANAVIRASNIRPFHYSHQGSLAYIGSDKAIADLPFFQGNVAAAGFATYYFWRSVYLSQQFSLKNRLLVAIDWTKCKVLGRDVSRE